MAENRTTPVTGNVTQEGDAPVADGWVSPDVAAAESGETVDFSKHVFEDDVNPHADA